MLVTLVNSQGDSSVSQDYADLPSCLSITPRHDIKHHCASDNNPQCDGSEYKYQHALHVSPNTICKLDSTYEWGTQIKVHTPCPRDEILVKYTDTTYYGTAET